MSPRKRCPFASASPCALTKPLSDPCAVCLAFPLQHDGRRCCAIRIREAVSAGRDTPVYRSVSRHRTQRIYRRCSLLTSAGGWTAVSAFVVGTSRSSALECSGGATHCLAGTLPSRRTWRVVADEASCGCKEGEVSENKRLPMQSYLCTVLDVNRKAPNVAGACRSGWLAEAAERWRWRGERPRGIRSTPG